MKTTFSKLRSRLIAGLFLTAALPLAGCQTTSGRHTTSSDPGPFPRYSPANAVQTALSDHDRLDVWRQTQDELRMAELEKTKRMAELQMYRGLNADDLAPTAKPEPLEYQSQRSGRGTAMDRLDVMLRTREEMRRAEAGVRYERHALKNAREAHHKRNAQNGELAKEITYCRGKIERADEKLSEARQEGLTQQAERWAKEVNAWEQRLQAASRERRNLLETLYQIESKRKFDASAVSQPPCYPEP